MPAKRKQRYAQERTRPPRRKKSRWEKSRTADPGLPTDPYTTADEISAALMRFKTDAGPYVHPNPISFTDGTTKDSWKGTLPDIDIDKRDHLGDFLRTPIHGRTCRIGFFSCPQANWVGTGNDWQGDPWHCFAAMLVNDEKKGKHLLVYDNDAKEGIDEDARISSVLRGLQRNLWSKIDQRCGLAAVWYSTNRSNYGSGMCLYYALRQVQSWASMPDRAFQKDDLRVLGFIPLVKK